MSKLFGVAPCLLSKLMLKYILIHIKTDSNGFRSGHPKTQLYPQTYLSASEEPYRPNDEMLKKKFHIKTNRPLHPFWRQEKKESLTQHHQRSPSNGTNSIQHSTVFFLLKWYFICYSVEAVLVSRHHGRRNIFYASAR